MDLDSDNKPYSNLYQTNNTISLEPIKSSSFSFFSLIKFFLFFIILFLVFHFRDNILFFIKNTEMKLSDIQISNKLVDDINNPPPPLLEQSLISEPEPNNNMSSGKKGWCYIGKNKDTLNVCSFVGVNDICMSGDIFPTKNQCINQNLR